MYSVIYISGSGRSGSTLFERILHSSSNVCAIGEFHCLWRLPPDKITCACGSSFAADLFWKQVLAQAGFDEVTLAELHQLEEKVCRTGYIARHGFSLTRLRRQGEVQRFLELNHRLFAAIAAVSEGQTIVDSSKAGPRAWLLACDPAVKVIHLYRDPGEVILSWRSSKFDPGLGTEMQRLSIGAAARDWWKVEQLARLLAAQHRVHRVDYARLCHAPSETVTALMADLLPAAAIAPRWHEPGTFEPRGDYHSLNGNPDRFSHGQVRITPRLGDWTRLDPAERRRARTVGGVLAVIYPPKHDATPSHP